MFKVFVTPHVSGFHITLANGYLVSVAFGPFNYCANRNTETPNWQASETECENAEIAVFAPDGKMMGEPIGYQSASDLLAVLMEAHLLPLK